MGEALGRQIQQGASRKLGLGSLERAEHQLLARNAGGIRQALRLHSRRGEEGASHSARWRTGNNRSGKSEGGGVSPTISGALCNRQELRHRKNRSSTRFHQLS